METIKLDHNSFTAENIKTITEIENVNITTTLDYIMTVVLNQVMIRQTKGRHWVDIEIGDFVFENLESHQVEVKTLLEQKGFRVTLRDAYRTNSLLCCFGRGHWENYNYLHVKW